MIAEMEAQPGHFVPIIDIAIDQDRGEVSEVTYPVRLHETTARPDLQCADSRHKDESDGRKDEPRRFLLIFQNSKGSATERTLCRFGLSQAPRVS